MSAGAATNKEAAAQQQFRRNAEIVGSGSVPEIATILETMRANMKKIPRTLPKAFVLSDVIPVLQDLIERHSAERQIVIHALYILYFLLTDNSTEGAHAEFLDLFDGKMELYVAILKGGAQDDDLCRIVLGFLRVLCAKAANRVDVGGGGICEILHLILTNNTRHAKVYNGVALLILRLISSDAGGKAIMLGGNLYEPLLRIFESTEDEENEESLSLLFLLLVNRSPSVKEVIRGDITRFVAIANNVGSVAYIRLDKMMSALGFTVLGTPIAVPYTLTTPKFYERLAEAGGAMNAYMTLGHGRELFEEELPVPQGCVYVTFAVCGLVSKDLYRLLNAVRDPHISVLLADPIKNLRALTTYFGKSLHVHYPGAKNPTSRTYYNTSFLPLVSWKTDKCTLGKSGFYRIGGSSGSSSSSVSDFSMPDPLPRTQYVSETDCDDITQDELEQIYAGSIYPTYDMFVKDLDPERTNTYDIVIHNARKFRFSQAWAFQMFPGVHYNFLCRGSSHPDEEPVELNARTTEFIARRRGLSNAAAVELLGSVNVSGTTNVSGVLGGGRNTRRTRRAKQNTRRNSAR
jgi:hypothetical protein